MKKKIAAALTALVLLLNGCGLSANADNTAITVQKNGETVMEISSSYVWLYTLMYKDQYEGLFDEDFWNQAGDDGVTNEEMLKQDMLEEIQHVKLVTLAAQEAGMSLTAEEVEFCKSNAAEYIDTIEKATQKKTGIDEEVYARFEEDFALYEKYKTEYLANQTAEVDEEELRQSDLFVLPFYTYEYNDEGEVTEFTGAEKEEVKKKAEEAYAMLQSGQTMEAVAAAYDMDPEDCMYVTGRTPMEEQDEYYDAAFENAAFSLREGECSPVTECLDGYYIIQMVNENNEEETAAAIESAKESLLETMFHSHVSEMTSTYQFAVEEKIWNKITFQADIGFVTEEDENE